jgi:DNA invertase Pin-like site-specific DNA recombinase
MIKPKIQVNNIYGYVRVSSAQQVKHGSSIEQQKKSISEFVATKYGREVDEFFVDAGVSGMKPLLDREGSRALTDIMDKDDVIVCTKLDRLARSFLEMVNMIPNLEESGITLYFCDMFADIPVVLPKDETNIGLNSRLDMNRMSNQMLINNLAMFAEFERDAIMSRLYGGKIAYAEKGYSIGGKTPFGYSKEKEINGTKQRTKLIPIPEEQEVLKTIYAHKARGLGARRIAKLVSSLHPKFPNFSVNKVQRILNRKFQGLLDMENEQYEIH